MMGAFEKYAWVGVTAARSNFAYFGEVAARIIFLGVILFIFLCLWRVTFAETGATRLGGLTLAQMLWYLAVTESIILSTPRVSQEVDRDVRVGTVAVYLTKPLSYPLYRLWLALGERSVRFTVNLLVGCAIALVFVGPIPISPTGLGLFVLALPLAFVVDFLGTFLVGLGAFWMEDTAGLTLIYSRVTMILGGLLIPVELFPAWLQPVVKWLPFSSIVYGPSRLFVHPDPYFLAGLLIRQLVAVGVFALIVAAVYRLAIRRVSANGG